MRSVAALMEDLDDRVMELDRVSKEQDEWAEKLGMAQRAWEEVYDDFLEELAADYTKRWPGEDVRVSLCRRENRDVWRELKRAEWKMDKLARRSASLGRQINGLQSELKTLAAEGALA